MDGKWFAIMICVAALGFFSAMGVISNNNTRLNVEQEKTHQLQIQLDLEKLKK